MLSKGAKSAMESCRFGYSASYFSFVLSRSLFDLLFARRPFLNEALNPLVCCTSHYTFLSCIPR
jgi:hypothetical protein